MAVKTAADFADAIKHKNAEQLGTNPAPNLPLICNIELNQSTRENPTRMENPTVLPPTSNST